jgi:CheY-like chemotaxis protein
MGMAEDRPRRVLVVSRDAATTATLLDALSARGYEVAAASTYERALDILAGWPVNLILLDEPFGTDAGDGPMGSPDSARAVADG